MAEPGKSLAKPAWLTITLFTVVTIALVLLLRPYALQLVNSRIVASAAAGALAGLVAWPIAGGVVRSLFRQ